MILLKIKVNENNKYIDSIKMVKHTVTIHKVNDEYQNIFPPG